VNRNFVDKTLVNDFLIIEEKFYQPRLGAGV